jgi:hypothetical protein
VRPERPFFDLQVRFAHTAARLAGMPLAAALLDCTNLYVRFGAGRDFDAANPLWKAYLGGLDEGASLADHCEWTWGYLQCCPVHRAAPRAEATFGCFSWAREPHGGVRLHFSAHTDDGRSPLATTQADARRNELRELVRQMGELGGAQGDPLVHGTSWLYNVPAYRRIFPAAYVASAQPVARLRALSLWGQFLDRHGRLREDAAAAFIERAEGERAFAKLAACFPLQALAVRAPLSIFQTFLNL